MKEITLVVAHARNRVIGKDNKLLWTLPSDMKHFRELTTNGIVIMGRKTWESLPEQYRPLPNRINVICSRNPKATNGLIRYIDDIEEFVKYFKTETYAPKGVFIIGGQSIYEAFLPHATKIIATQIHADFEGDAFFPELSQADWEIQQRCSNPEENGLQSEVVTYVRRL